MISILILTHNRPKLFERCILSVINSYYNSNCLLPIEILVNNDSKDIVEIKNDLIKYFYKENNDLSKLYNHLFNEAKNDYIFFLEDDDYLHPDFFKEVANNIDSNIIFMNYYPAEERIFELFKNNVKLININDKNEFIKNYDPEHFQLSQILFKKNLVQEFPTGNKLNNDYLLFKNMKNSNIKYIFKALWYQTTDGKDNISFPHYNKDSRWKD